ncbi:MAG: hypothetical protein KA059_05060 [Elusimicrobiales bacterium]|nr:hypothetical protein [Elusimicrobiales bacterium]
MGIFKFEEKRGLIDEIKKNNTSYIIGEKPQIEVNKKTGDYTIILSSEMDKALKEYEKKHYGYPFNILNAKNFKKDIINSYPFGIYQSPSAVLGDFNGDGIIDVVLMGYIDSEGVNPGVIMIESNSFHKKKKEKKKKSDDIVMLPIYDNINIPIKEEKEEPEYKYIVKEMLLYSITENVNQCLNFHKKGEVIDSHNKGCARETGGVITLKTDAFGFQSFDFEGDEMLFNYSKPYASTGCNILK